MIRAHTHTHAPNCACQPMNCVFRRHSRTRPTRVAACVRVTYSPHNTHTHVLEYVHLIPISLTMRVCVYNRYTMIQFLPVNCALRTSRFCVCVRVVTRADQFHHACTCTCTLDRLSPARCRRSASLVAGSGFPFVTSVYKRVQSADYYYVIIINLKGYKSRMSV